MEIANEKIIKLQAEVDYYKKQLNELSGGIVSRDYKVVELNNEIKQMQTGFALIAALNQFKPAALFGEIFDHFTEEINIQLQNDMSLVLLPDIKMPDFFSPAFIKGYPGAEVNVIAEDPILIDPYFLQQKSSLLVNSQTILTPFIKLLIKRFGIPYFILTPVIVQDKVIACLFTGRKKETILFASSRLLMHNAHALEAIAGVIAALKNQDDQFYLIEKERLRISSDMHDEIGSGITHIALLSELIQTQHKEEKEFKKDINLIATSARKLVQTISEIIWTLSPQNDTLEDLLAYTREQSQQYFESLDMKFDVDFPDAIPPIKLSSEERRNLYLVTREALNNAMKHSGASAIVLKMEITNTIYRYRVIDNGKGMIKKHNTTGHNGIRNMKKRMEDIGGTINWLPLDKGTTVEYCLPV
jgi:signal transduction histidine kinase